MNRVTINLLIFFYLRIEFCAIVALLCIDKLKQNKKEESWVFLLIKKWNIFQFDSFFFYLKNKLKNKNQQIGRLKFNKKNSYWKQLFF